MIRIASADHGSGMPPGLDRARRRSTSTRSPPPDSGSAATVCAPSPSEPGAGRSTACLSAARSPAPPAARSSPRPAAAGRRRSRRRRPRAPPYPDIRPTSRTLVDTSTGHSERPVSATGHAATASTCPAASSRPDRGVVPLARVAHHRARVEVAAAAATSRPAVSSSSYRPKPSTPRRNGSHHGSVSNRSRSVS